MVHAEFCVGESIIEAVFALFFCTLERTLFSCNFSHSGNGLAQSGGGQLRYSQTSFI